MTLLAAEFTPTFIQQTNLYETLRSEFIVAHVGVDAVQQAEEDQRAQARSVRIAPASDIHQRIRDLATLPPASALVLEQYGNAFDHEAARRFKTVGGYALHQILPLKFSVTKAAPATLEPTVLGAYLNSATYRVTAYALGIDASSGLYTPPQLDLANTDVATIETGIEELTWLNTVLQTIDPLEVPLEAA